MRGTNQMCRDVASLRKSTAKFNWHCEISQCQKWSSKAPNRATPIINDLMAHIGVMGVTSGCAAVFAKMLVNYFTP